MEETEFDYSAHDDVRVLTVDDPTYPENLRLSLDTPKALYVKGTLLPQDRVAVAIVGTRSPSPSGGVIAYEIARDLASTGVTVVSGLAMGIDAKAHLGAIEGGGRTIACLGAGVDIVYPQINADLFTKIPKHGALVSEYVPGTLARQYQFPERNRIISGLSLGVVVVEAGEHSGALITVEWAQRQQKEVMAVPGSPKSLMSKGTNRLIQDGAYLVTSARDVLSFLGREGEWVPALGDSPCHDSRSLTFDEGAVFNEVQKGPTSADEVHDRLPGFTLGRVIGLLAALEVKGIVVKVAGGKYLAKS